MEAAGSPAHPAYGRLRAVTATASVLLADNPGPLTLEGTNTWILRGAGSDEIVVVDPGPDDADHIAGCHRHVKTLEECAMGEPAGHVLRDEGCGHGSMFSPPLSYGADEAVASDP